MFPGHVWISSDEVRQRLMGDRYDGSMHKLVWKEWYEHIEFNLSKGISVIADATNLLDKHRHNLIRIASDRSATTHAVVFRNVSQAVKRNNARPTHGRQGTVRVPDGAMINFVMLYERMLIDIETESYDSVTFIERTL